MAKKSQVKVTTSFNLGVASPNRTRGETSLWLSNLDQASRTSALFLSCVV